MYSFSICSVFKNESHILQEWLEHYIYHGVEHFYLVNDFSTDDYLSIINQYSQYVTLFDNDIVTKDVGRQTQIYDKYFKPIMSESKWLAIIDLDEFVYSPYELDIKKIIETFDSYSQITIDWLHFGSNEHILQPNSVVEGFTKRAEFTTSKPYYSYKPIFQPTYLISFGIHRHNMHGPQIHLNYDNQKLPPLIMNHYAIQSRSFFMEVKAKRGDVNNWFDHKNLQRNREYFDGYDINDVIDMSLYEQNKNIIQKLKLSKIDQTKNDVTLVITSCNRSFLLDKTLESFVKFNTYPINTCIIIDDSGIPDCNETVVAKYSTYFNVNSLYNKTNIRQLPSIDKAYSYVKTKYIFHCEEDWEFLEPGFIEKSMNIFDLYPAEKIFTTWLRPHNCTSLHPIIYDKLNRGFYSMDKQFSYMFQGVKYTWCGVTFNPGLRKTSDMLLLHPYSPKCEQLIKDGKSYPAHGEYTVNKLYSQLGYYGVILDKPSGHVKHIGFNHHIAN
jgi:hypothetical protein